ncbi:Clp protease N-terminal domain-containing protein [Streptacidiphilus sp. ASG 303]|uniref:Clp protease N-terminal domain-containing protein n=1 Tax=Streptacidiphilus sp. ASG 303 TaxID=2896847 RepID=UPI001E581451|nr:Clp protease N-terminal domain-containing protein [Streptacidiphilus sp. ASG 303]MCD0484442.1 Clp protease N-terminal domain-containing protein [Streptacidiphilus sp. ASG 303]
MQPELLRTTPLPATPAVLGAVAAAARRRAARAGDEAVDTGHLLHSLLESDAAALEAAAPLPRQAVRLMGYLVQRSIGFGRGWRATAEQPGADADAEGDADADAEGGAVPDTAGAEAPRSAPDRPGLSGAAVAALEEAAARPEALPVGHRLLAALLADPDSRAAQILRSSGIDPVAVRARCAGVRQTV